MNYNPILHFISYWVPIKKSREWVDKKHGSARLGFMLIELIVATMIASMVAAVLLTALNLGGRSQTTIDTTIDMSERVAIVTNQLEKDLMGAFIPVQSELKKDSKDSVAPKEEKKEDKKDSKNVQDAAAGGQPAAEKKEPKPIEKIFYSTNKDGMLDTLTFITNDPLVVFVSKDVGETKPKVARVQYTLRPEPEKKDSYVLFRQESKELDLAEYKNVRSYEVIGGIKRCVVKFIAKIEKKSEKKAGAADEKAGKEENKISYEYKELPEWVSEQKKEKSGETEKDKKPEFPRIPYRVEFKITLWDKQDKRDKDFVMNFEIPVDFTEPKKEEKKQPETPNKDAQKPAPGGKGNQPQDGQSKGQEVALIETLSTTLGNLTKIFRQM
jgi:type II secretory pathway component PulJ